MHRQRTYRNRIHGKRLKTFRVAVKETDLFVSATADLSDVAREAVLNCRTHLENFIRCHPEFLDSLVPLVYDEPLPGIVSAMLEAGLQAGVGPMAAVAGAVAERVGSELLRFSKEVIVENGGDVFIKSDEEVIIGLFAGRSPLSLRIGLRIPAGLLPIAVCTSSGTVGHSISFGTADAACAIADSCALADAAATAIGNRVKVKGDIPLALEFGKKIKGVRGVMLIKDDKVGLWGDLDIVSLEEKKVEF